MKWGRLVCASLTALLLVLAFLLGLPRHDSNSLSASQLAYTPHDPIYIVGNAGFNSTNGVVRGDGTQNNPYVIEGWEVNASTADYAGVSIWFTDAYFVINDLWIHSGGLHTEGIDLYFSDHGVLSGNTIERNSGGIVASECNDIVIADNTLRQNDYGIAIEDSAAGNVTHNQVMANTGTGIWIGRCENTSVYWNHVFDNRIGIGTWGGHNDTVTWNNISENDLGISASNDPAAGLPILIFHNNLWSNTEQAHDYEDHIISPGVVVWNATYPQGGNFWSDYVGSDLCSGPNQDTPGADGIGDTDYDINMSWWGEPGYSTPDYYPLMRPMPMNWAPVAAFTVDPVTGDTLTVFRFNASNSSDLEDPISELTFRWDWEGDGVWDTDWTTEETAQCQYSGTGVYTVRLEVKDSQGLTNNTTMQIEVLEAIPEFSTVIVPVLSLLFLVAAVDGRRLRRNRRKKTG